MSEFTDPAIPTPEPVIATIEDAVARAAKIGYPILVRPWGADENAGTLFHIVNGDDDLRRVFPDALRDSVHEDRVDLIHLSGRHETKSYIPTPK
ncbi:MAG: hypothetical protein AAB440_01795 [Patescibacteria group bacterium]